MSLLMCRDQRKAFWNLFFLPTFTRTRDQIQVAGILQKGSLPVDHPCWPHIINLLLLFFFLNWGKVSCRSGWPVSCFAAKVVLELLILLPPSSSYSGCRCAPLHPASICTVLKATLASCYGFSLCVFSLATLSWNSVNLHVLLLIRDQHQDFKCPWKHM